MSHWRYWHEGEARAWAAGEALPPGAELFRAEFLNQFVAAIRERYAARYEVVFNALPGPLDPYRLNDVRGGDDVQQAAFWNGLRSALRASFLSHVEDVGNYTYSYLPAEGDVLFDLIRPGPALGLETPELSPGDYITARHVEKLRRDIAGLNPVLCWVIPARMRYYRGLVYWDADTQGEVDVWGPDAPAVRDGYLERCGRVYDSRVDSLARFRSSLSLDTNDPVSISYKTPCLAGGRHVAGALSYALPLSGGATTSQAGFHPSYGFRDWEGRGYYPPDSGQLHVVASGDNAGGITIPQLFSPLRTPPSPRLLLGRAEGVEVAGFLFVLPSYAY